VKVFLSAFKTKGNPRSRAQATEPRSRDDVVAAQYNTPNAAAGYADSHEGLGPAARYFRSRINLISQTLASSPGGDLLDVGCGPGMMVRELLDSRPGDFRITVLDRSPAMVEACALRAASANNFRALVGRVEAMPFADASFDVVLVMGILEYAESTAALAEIARVVRPDGLVLMTMLNPMSPYRFVEWHVYWPLQRVLRAVETLLNVPPDRRHGPPDTGIRAYRERTLRGMIAAVGLRPVNAAYFDITLLIPPIDRLVRRWARGWQKRPEHTISRGWRKWLGTAYMIVAHKAAEPTGFPMSTPQRPIRGSKSHPKSPQAGHEMR
jgi:ubiquinone/menaquinone biosynthesis C-methylase UbiE